MGIILKYFQIFNNIFFIYKYKQQCKQLGKEKPPEKLYENKIEQYL